MALALSGLFLCVRAPFWQAPLPTAPTPRKNKPVRRAAMKARNRSGKPTLRASGRKQASACFRRSPRRCRAGWKTLPTFPRRTTQRRASRAIRAADSRTSRLRRPRKSAVPHRRQAASRPSRRAASLRRVPAPPRKNRRSDCQTRRLRRHRRLLRRRRARQATAPAARAEKWSRIVSLRATSFWNQTRFARALFLQGTAFCA